MSKIPPCQIAVYRVYGKRLGCRYEYVVFVEDGKEQLIGQKEGYALTKWGAIIKALSEAGFLTFKHWDSCKKVFEYDNRGKS